jgi:hypothetical protein
MGRHRLKAERFEGHEAPKQTPSERIDGMQPHPVGHGLCPNVFRLEYS